jgi:hypothetical protein
MKLFKISFISIISILIFQSQLYGINLRCEFKEKVNETEFNGFKCNYGKSPICNTEESGRYNYWISKIVISDKDVIIFNEPTDVVKNNFTKEEIKSFNEKFGKDILKVESIFHQPKPSWMTTQELDRYIFVLRDGILLYSLLFDNISKKSILTSYNSLHMEGSKLTNITNSDLHFGECEVID